MILVLFFVLFMLIILILCCSYIKINIEDVIVSNIPEFHYNFIIKFGLYLFNKVKLIEIRIDKEKLKNSKMMYKLKSKITKKDLTTKLKNADFVENIRKMNLNLEQIQLNIKLGTEDVILTSVIVTILSSTIGILLGKVIKRYDEGKYKYIILPFYNNKNLFEVKLNCIINAKLVHIIYVIYMFSKKRSENEYERASNRRSYDYSYE